MCEGKPFRLALVLLFAAALLGAPASSHADDQIVLSSAQVDLYQGVMVIHGQFDDRPLGVWLGDVPLPVYQQTNTYVAALLPADVQSGTYEVTVATSTDSGHVGVMSVAVGTAGPQGATGPRGPAGPAGTTGPAGPAGATGPAGPAGAAGAQGPAGPQGVPGPIGSQGPAGADGATGATGPQGPAGLSNYQVATIATTVTLASSIGTQQIVVDCPAGTNAVLSGFMYRLPGGVRHPFPGNVDWTSWPSGRAQLTFMLRNGNNFVYTDPVEAGVICAGAN
jgi:hypothetical protein